MYSNTDQDYEEEIVEDDVEDPQSVSTRSHGASRRMSGSFGGYNSSSQRSDVPPLNQSELITRSMQQQNRPSAQLMSNGRQVIGNSMATRSTQQNVSPEQPMAVAGSRSAPPLASQPKDGVERMRHWVLVLGVLILICLAVAAVVVPLYVAPQYKIAATPPQPSETTAPRLSEAPSVSPIESSQPTTEDFGTFVKSFAKEISGSIVFEDPSSPQYKAVEFIANDANYTLTITDDATLKDFYAIAVFYYSTGGDYWFKCSQGSDECPGGVSWMTDDVNYCKWNWITCNDAGRVEDIIFSDVQGNNLTGTLTSELALLTELKQFAAINDDISGSLPDKLGDLTEVTHFILSNNSMSGKIPGDFLQDSPLEVFMVSDNKFKGEIPESLTTKSTLYQLFLDSNRLSGSIPKEFGSLPNLSTLDLTENQLSGEIPDEIYSGSIQNLYLGGSTNIKGTLSSAVGQAVNLVRLHITGTRMSGGIPDELFALPFLTELVLSNNTLTGELSESVADLGGTLRVLKLDGNKFSGNLPNVAIDELFISNILTFDRNSFTGAISPTTCRRKGLGHNNLQIITVDCNEVTCSCCNNCEE